MTTNADATLCAATVTQPLYCKSNKNESYLLTSCYLTALQLIPLQDNTSASPCIRECLEVTAVKKLLRALTALPNAKQLVVVMQIVRLLMLLVFTRHELQELIKHLRCTDEVFIALHVGRHGNLQSDWSLLFAHLVRTTLHILAIVCRLVV